MYSKDENWRDHRLIDKYKDRLAEVRRWYLVYLMAHGPPKLTWTPPGPNTSEYIWTKESLTKQIHDLLDAGQDVPAEFLDKLDDFNNDTHNRKVREVLAGQQALV